MLLRRARDINVQDDAIRVTHIRRVMLILAIKKHSLTKCMFMRDIFGAVIYVQRTVAAAKLHIERH